jgi:hypothetical protein
MGFPLSGGNPAATWKTGFPARREPYIGKKPGQVHGFPQAAFAAFVNARAGARLEGKKSGKFPKIDPEPANRTPGIWQKSPESGQNAGCRNHPG